MKSLMGEERKLLPKALFFSLVMGCVMPLNGFLISKIVTKMTEY